jgi:hypothetical protein
MDNFSYEWIIDEISIEKNLFYWFLSIILIKKFYEKLFYQFIWDEIFSGTLIYFDLGQVKSGFWPGAAFTEVTRQPNPHPEKCYTETGVPKLVSDVSVLTIQKGHDKITCWGMYIDKFKPGINENWSEKLSIFSLQLKWFKNYFQMLQKWLFKFKEQNLPK